MILVGGPDHGGEPEDDDQPKKMASSCRPMRSLSRNISEPDAVDEGRVPVQMLHLKAGILVCSSRKDRSLGVHFAGTTGPAQGDGHGGRDRRPRAVRRPDVRLFPDVRPCRPTALERRCSNSARQSNRARAPALTRAALAELAWGVPARASDQPDAARGPMAKRGGAPPSMGALDRARPPHAWRPRNDRPRPEYAPAKVWSWNRKRRPFANINRPTGRRMEQGPARRPPSLQLYSLARPNGVKVTVDAGGAAGAGPRRAEYDAWLIRSTRATSSAAASWRPTPLPRSQPGGPRRADADPGVRNPGRS